MIVANTGKLYIVSTPIGNLEDITLRALDVLKNAGAILSEDTRETDKLLKKYNIENKQYSYRDQNHERIVDMIIDLLKSGNDLALTSDSGTPLISDPGYKLVRAVLENGFTVESIPGPSSVITALVVSGLPTDKFAFLGFLPKSSGQRKRILSEYGNLDCTLTIFESPYRIDKLLFEVSECLGNRYVCIVKDLTKHFESTTRGYINDLKSLYSKTNKGEFVVMIAKKDFIPNF